MKELGRFHLASRGFQSNSTTNERAHLGCWAQSYERHLEELIRFKSLVKSSSTTEFEKLYVQHVEHYISQGKEALSLVQGPNYANWVNKAAVQKNLCHQDFAAANLIKTSSGLVIIDMDSITFDLPARDIRNIFNKVMKKYGWNSSKAASMLRAYREVHPLSEEECQIIYADLLFPHLFYGLASKYFNKRTEWNHSNTLRKLQGYISSEKDREHVLASWRSIVRQF